MATSSTDFDHPYYEQLKKIEGQERINFFTENKGKRMKFVSLGESLDFISYGGGNFVFYPLNTHEMTKFIGTWMRGQKPKIEYKRINLSENSYRYEEIKREYNYIWNRFDHDFSINGEFPIINYESCPHNELHKKTLFDRAERLRCAECEEFEVKPNFTRIYITEDLFSRTKRYNFSENEPYDPTPDVWENEEGEEVDWSEEYNEYLKKKEEYDGEEPMKVKDVCYAIIKEPVDVCLSLETILERINCSHECDSAKSMLLPFSGFTLANYVKAWYKQKGKKRVWKKEKEIDFYNHFADFQAFSTSD